MQDRKCTRRDGSRTEHTEDKMDAERGTRLMQDRTYTGKDESRTKLSKQITQMQNSTYSYEGQDGCRTGWMQEWTDAVQMQDRTNTGLDGCRTGRISDMVMVKIMYSYFDINQFSFTTFLVFSVKYDILMKNSKTQYVNRQIRQESAFLLCNHQVG